MRFLCPAVGPLVIPGNSISSSSWSSYWTKQTSLLLFFGEVSKLTGGKIYNEMVGSSDYLTVTGSPGSYHYTCPNTAPYIAADTDYAWFKGDGSVSDMTSSRLVTYDLQRTPVKYDDSSPYTERWIAIIKAGVVLTSQQRDNLFEGFQLPIFWDNSLNAYGHVKGNRLGQNLWIPESYGSTPVLQSAVISDTDNTKINLTYDINLNTTAPVTSVYTLTGKTISNISISGMTVTITVTVGYLYGDVISINYTVPGSNPIESLLGSMPVASLISQSVTNNILHYFTLTSAGTGAGVATFALTVSSTLTITLNNNGYFYTDSGGTLGQTQTWSPTAGGQRTIYIKVTSGVSLMRFSNPLLITIFSNAWTQPANAPAITGDVSKLSNLTYLVMGSTCTLGGSIANLTLLTTLYAYTTNLFTGSINGLTSLSILYSNSSGLSGDITGLTTLTSIDILSTPAITGSVTNLTSLTRLYISANNNITGLIDSLIALTYLYINTSTGITGDIGLHNMVNGCTNFLVTSGGFNAYTTGAVYTNNSYTISPAVSGYTSTMIDNILIDMAASIALISKSITLQGVSKARSASSNAAVATLTGAGRTNTITTNAPTLQTATVENGAPANIILTFDVALTESPVPATTAFVTVPSKTVSNVSISGAVVTVTVSVPFIHGNTITIAYTKPGSNNLTATYTLDVATFGAKSVTNNIL